MTLMHLWDQALDLALKPFYGQPSSPQVLYRVKKAIVHTMRDQHHLPISSDDFRKIRVEWLENEQSANLVIPPNLLTKTVH